MQPRCSEGFSGLASSLAILAAFRACSSAAPVVSMSTGVELLVLNLTPLDFVPSASQKLTLCCCAHIALQKEEKEHGVIGRNAISSMKLELYKCMESSWPITLVTWVILR